MCGSLRTTGTTMMALRFEVQEVREGDSVHKYVIGVRLHGGAFAVHAEAFTLVTANLAKRELERERWLREVEIARDRHLRGAHDVQNQR